jgi:hypothetical protein
MADEKLAEVILRQGRLWLVVGGLYIAMQGDPLHDSDLPADEHLKHHVGRELWGEKALRKAARIINRQSHV